MQLSPWMGSVKALENLLSQKVYRQLYDAMLDHRLRPGDRLNRRQVAHDLGVSVAPCSRR